ncbi:MAG: hypothetical protein IKH51_11245 [Clostridia bacterium]|nr:hypothetical protein [Clostridia bacterium]
MDYKIYNDRVFECMSMYLNLAPHFINEEMYINTGGDELAYSALLAAVCMLDTVNSPDDKILYRKYFIPMVHRLDPADFEDDPYYKTVKFDEKELGAWRLKHLTCKAYEAFVCGDPDILPDGRILPKIGYFERDFEYPAVLENGREWMTLLPNETITIKPHVKNAAGRVLTFGLGLGYFAFSAAQKDDVSSVTVVERDGDVIKLFCDVILPQFPNKEKIKIIQADAFEYAEQNYAKRLYDYVFTDIWHDASDGVDLYLKMKEYEKLCPECRYEYWIENTLKLYIRS